MQGDAGKDPPGMPGWVKVFGIIGIVLVLVLLAVLVFGGSQHGPGRHGSPPSSTDGTTSAHESGSHMPPPTHHTAAPRMANFMGP